MDKHVLKCIRKGKDPTIAKIILKKTSKLRRVIFLMLSPVIELQLLNTGTGIGIDI